MSVGCSDSGSGPTTDVADATSQDTSQDTSEDTSVEADSAEDVAADTSVAPDTALPPRTEFEFEPVEVVGVDPRWGAQVTDGLLLGGVDGRSTVQSAVYSASLSGTTVTAERVAGMGAARYCQCAFVDEGRHELVALGGRGKTFGDMNSIVRVDLTTDEAVSVPNAGAADFPVGCHAFFSSPNDRGYVFGGLSTTGGRFTSDTYRWDPETATFTKLAGDGPPARYDSSLRVLDDGGALLVSGMGFTGSVVFYQDIWRFDPGTESWSEIVPKSGVRPPGRRYAWTALSPDESMLIFGFGSDSPMGQSVLGDLWAFDFDALKWAPLDVAGELPTARGFTWNWQISEGDAGLLAFGSDAATKVVEDAFILRVPDAMRGRWH